MSLLRGGTGSVPDITQKFARLVRNRAIIPRGARILVAVSGGADSVCLLHLLKEYQEELDLSIHVVHVEHGLRAEESERDARFVEEMAKGLSLPFHLARVDVRGLAHRAALSVQEAARGLRYGFFEEVRRTTGADLLATAHTADDQAEELLMRLIRGSGLPGLSGIAAERDGWIIRPLLACTRDEIVSYLSKRGIPWVEDSSNAKSVYLRNRVRAELLPFIKKRFNPSFHMGVERITRILADEDDYLEDVTRRVFEDACVEKGGGYCVLELECIRKVHPAIRRRVCRRAIQEAGLMSGSIRSVHIETFDRIVTGEAPGAWMPLPRGGRVERRYGRILVLKEKGQGIPCAAREVLVPGPGIWEDPAGYGCVEVARVPCPVSFPVPGDGMFPRTLWLADRDDLFPFVMRKRLPGDRFRPFGMATPVKLKDFFMARKVPRSIRDHIPILVKGGRVMCVCGVEISEEYRVTSGAKGAVSIRWMTDAGLF
ncbi:MAG: tRNA lysidine(34) synthetase TilS [Deltaproteobacteria bacterium]